MEKTYDVACIGTCLMDISTSGLDFQTFLENEPNLAEGITYGCGGDANNQSIVLSRLGHKVAFLGCTGDDFVGRFICETAEKAGVDMSHISKREDVPTAANNILIGADDKRVYTISKNRTSRTELCGTDIDMDVVRNARAVSIGSIFVHPKLDQDLGKILKEAKRSGAITFADVCPSGEACSLEDLKEAVSCLDYLFVNETEAQYLSGKEDLSHPEEIAAYFQSLGVTNVIVKLGAKGSHVQIGSKGFFQPSFKVEKVVDTTGAGDCFASGFISGTLRGLSPQECAVFSTACSALTIQKIGATEAVTSMQLVETFIQKRQS